jgi:hypothetical protein
VKHKFSAQRTTVDDINFDSKIESRYYQNLKMLQRSGELLFFLRQVPIHLPGKTKLVIDFVEFWKDGNVVFTDVKGVETETFKLKRRQVEELYPIEINVVTKV